MLGSTRGNFYAGTVVGRGLTLEDTFDLAELTAHFLDHLLGGTAHGFHREAAEQEGGHGTDESAHEDARVHQVHLEVVHEVGDGGLGGGDDLALEVRKCNISPFHRDFYLFDVGS